MPTKIDLKLNMNWFQTSEFAEDGVNKTKTFAGAVKIGGSAKSSIHVQVNLPALGSNNFPFMLAQPIGTSASETEAFTTRVVRITLGPEGNATIQIRRVDKASSWDMPLQLNLLLVSVGTS